MSEINDLVAGLTSKDNSFAYRCLQQLEMLSRDSNEVYQFSDEFATMLQDNNSYIRARAIILIAANAKWDTDDKIDEIIDEYLRHINDEKPIVSRQCIEALPMIAKHKSDLREPICAALHNAKPYKYADSMQPLVSKDIKEALAEIATLKAEAPRSLMDMSLEELWQLFPVQLEEFNPSWTIWYDEETAALQAILGDQVARIDHIGSTSVPRLTAKPIVDILLQVAPICNIEAMHEALTANGWLLMADQRTPDFRSDWNKGYTIDGFAEKVYHLHIREMGDWDELHFRDYLRTHPLAASEYTALKRQLAIKHKHNRDAYTEAKGDFVRIHTAKARTVIRLEQPDDYREVEELTLAAFKTFEAEGVPKRDIPNEHFLVRLLRTDPQFVSELDLVAKRDDKIVGNIMYSECDIERSDGTLDNALTFGPVSVQPKYQGQGVGIQLVQHSLELAKYLGYKAVIITGHPTYYQRFGFVPASQYNLKMPDGSTFDAFMALELEPGALGVKGGIWRCCRAFDLVEDEYAFMEFHQEFIEGQPENSQSEYFARDA